MAKIYLYQTPDTGELSCKATMFTVNGKGQSKAMEFTLFIQPIGYINITRLEAVKLVSELTKQLSKGK